MVSFRFMHIAVIASTASALTNNAQPARFSLAEQAALSQGEASLLGGSTSYYSSQPLWSGKKNAEKSPLENKNTNQNQSFTPRTKSNQSSFVQRKSS
mmetsp:Transcript_311/g.827  ORF Transcript_311/g.827 Transcript_311/m.827 type:complete len:97 (-) Transcript_311:356-646(-)